MSDVRCWGHPDQWQGRDSAMRESALRAEIEHYRSALQQIADYPASVSYPKEWIHWSEQARRALETAPK